jgi:hypothetical protein
MLDLLNGMLPDFNTFYKSNQPSGNALYSCAAGGLRVITGFIVRE